ncbi:hypothetical protein Tco_0570300 [Tanacetum coccineum]
MVRQSNKGPNVTSTHRGVVLKKSLPYDSRVFELLYCLLLHLPIILSRFNKWPPYLKQNEYFDRRPFPPFRGKRLVKRILDSATSKPGLVEEVCVTCGSNHNFNNCPLTRNDFPVFQDNIHQFQQTAAVGNFVQRNPPNLANQIRPPGFNQPNVQKNQNRYQGTNSNFNQNRGGNFNQNRQNNQNQVYQAPPYQPPTNQPLVNQALPPVSQTQGVSKTDFESYAKANDANMITAVEVG